MGEPSDKTFRSGYVAIVGRPNVGKSTLINAILGEHLAIVTPKPQTTRHRITGIFNDDDAQIIFLDTPGYHLSTKPFNRAMIEVVGGVIDDADVVCVMVEPGSTEPDIDRKLFERAGRERAIVVVNKADTLSRSRFDETAQSIHEGWDAREVMLISALTGDGVPELVASVKRRLPEGPAYFPRDEYTDLTMRFLVAEIVREKLFVQMHEEIPYSSAVQIDSFEEPRGDDGLTRIAATIVVERDSQKAMVIGAKGARIKKIGQEARVAVEKLVGGRVFLELTVRVEKNWTKDDRRLEQLGYKITT